MRNSVYGSGKAKRLVTYEGNAILWSHWQDAYNWDKYINVIKWHHKLTDDHIYLDQAGKMRNKLAEECLDHNMLDLMEVKI